MWTLGILAMASGPAHAQDILARSLSSPTAVSLQDALARARERAPVVRAALEREQAAVTARSLVPRFPNPIVELRGENFGRHPPHLLTHDVFATISQPIELGGKRGARTASVNALATVASADVRVSEWTLAFDVAALYLEALRGRDSACDAHRTAGAPGRTGEHAVSARS
ncbi:MAG: hypothetical protein QM736_08325 [Vicinamibacterales bacterium]